ncbi:hypothetical protein BDW62DRAFT_199674 [Aspergillus aurantiobrunneus]
MTPQIVPYEVAETIRLKKSQYCRFADTRQWEAWGNLFIPSIKATFHNPDGSLITEGNTAFSFESRDELILYFRAAFETQQAIHIVGPGELQRLGEDEVSAVWPVVYHAASRGVDGGWSGTGGGHYYEGWKRIGDDWFIARFKFVREYWNVQGLGEGA